MQELYRICKIRTIIIIPYRFFPLDTHSMLPFIHWLPKKIHRKILKIFNYNFLAEEKNLNLLSKKDLIQICNKNKITNINPLSNLTKLTVLRLDGNQLSDITPIIQNSGIYEIDVSTIPQRMEILR